MKLSVLVPTLADSARAVQIQRCVQSIRLSSSDPIRIIVVVNGDRHDASICEWLQSQPDVQLEKINQPSLPGALLRGRTLVNTPFFSTLDDDDEYLPGSSDRKLLALEASPNAAYAVGNGFRREADSDTLLYRDLSAINLDPLESLFRIAWLNSGNAVYRTESVSPGYFEDLHRYAEWTWLAFRLCLDGKVVRVVDAPCVRINVTPGSLSHSESYRDAYLALYERMLSLSPPPSVGRLIRRRMGAAWHDRSTFALSRGERREALMSHLRSLLFPGGLRYVGYTRRLLPGWPTS